MQSDTVWFGVLIAAIAALAHILPGRTRPDLFFAVTVYPAFRRTSEGLRILARYRMIIWASAAVAIALVILAESPLAALLVEACGLAGALVDAHRLTLPHAAVPSPIREIDLPSTPERLPGWTVLSCLPLILLAALGFWVMRHPDRVPRRLPVHWGLHGADRWVAATPRTIFGLLGVYALLCLVMVAAAWGVLYWSRRISASGPAAHGERQFRGMLAGMLILIEYLIAFPAAAALLGLSNRAMTIWGMALTATVVVFLISLIRAGQGGSLAAPVPGVPVGDRTPDACWKWGLFYINPADPSILVEKRFGIGYTLNLGNRWSWVILAIILLPAAFGFIFLR